jgi:hypothetical protein
MRVIVLVALVVPCPTGVNPPRAARVILPARLSRLRPFLVRTTLIFALPVLWSSTFTVATRVLRAPRRDW